MRIKIRDWDKHFEQDRSRQWKHLKWVPIPNKQGTGYRKIMLQKNGASIFGCWIALVEQGSLCEPRGDLSKYSLSDLAILTLLDEKALNAAIEFLSKELDWIEVIENLDISLTHLDNHGKRTCDSSSILCNSVLSNLELRSKEFKDSILSIKAYPQEMLQAFFKYWSEPNRSKTKMRFELQPTWELSRRLTTWAARDKNINHKKESSSERIDRLCQQQLSVQKIT